MEAFKIKNGISATRYLGSNGTETAGSVGYDLAGASYDSVSFSVSSQATFSYSLAFNADGTKVYVVGLLSASVFQYSLSTAFDISTASYDSVSFNFSAQDVDGNMYKVVFKGDGTKMYLLSVTNDSVFQYSLSTAFDLSTASYDSVSFNVTSQDGIPVSLAFNNDGTKMYILGNANDSVYQYSLSTAFDVSTASYDSVSFSVAAQENQPFIMALSSDGTKMYIAGATNKSIFQYGLSTAYDLSTASYDSVSFGLSSQDSAPQDIVFNSDGAKMYMIGDANDTIYQYSTVGYTQTLDLSTGTTFSFTPSGATTVSFTNPPASGNAIGFSVEVVGDGSAITWPSSVKWHGGAAPTATASKELYVFVSTDGGTTYYGRKAGSFQ